jgi:hypothetical protein
VELNPHFPLRFREVLLRYWPYTAVSVDTDTPTQPRCACCLLTVTHQHSRAVPAVSVYSDTPTQQSTEGSKLEYTTVRNTVMSSCPQ